MSEYDKQVVSWLALHGFIVARKQLGFVVDCPTCGESWEIPHNDQLGVTEWRRLPQKIADRLT